MWSGVNVGVCVMMEDLDSLCVCVLNFVCGFDVLLRLYGVTKTYEMEFGDDDDGVDA